MSLSNAFKLITDDLVNLDGPGGWLLATLHRDLQVAATQRYIDLKDVAPDLAAYRALWRLLSLTDSQYHARCTILMHTAAAAAADDDDHSVTTFDTDHLLRQSQLDLHIRTVW